MSRARYSAAVMGDPVVLCTFGSCRTIWQKYVKACETLRSIFPDTYNMRRINMEMQSLSESDSGRELLRLLSQYRTQQQQLLQQAANACAVALWALWADRRRTFRCQTSAATRYRAPTCLLRSQRRAAGLRAEQDLLWGEIDFARRDMLEAQCGWVTRVRMRSVLPSRRVHASRLVTSCRDTLPASRRMYSALTSNTYKLQAAMSTDI